MKFLLCFIVFIPMASFSQLNPLSFISSGWFVSKTINKDPKSQSRIPEIRFEVDTLIVDGALVAIQRAKPGEISKYLSRGETDRRVAILLQDIETDLKLHRGKRVPQLARQIERIIPGPDLTLYRMEAAAYKLSDERGAEIILNVASPERKRLARTEDYQQALARAEQDAKKSPEDSLVAMRRAKAELAKKASLEKEFGIKTAKIIMEGSVVPGMSKKAVEYSWGNPANITDTKTEKGVITTYYYNGGRYATFLNGVVVSIGDK